MMNQDTYFRGPTNHHDGIRTIRDSRDAFGYRFQSPLARKYDSLRIALVFLVAFIGIGLVGSVNAQSPVLVDPVTGKFLGNVNNNPLDPDSISNPVGRYGSPLSQDSINNPLSQYGNPISSRSVNNPLGTGTRYHNQLRYQLGN